MNRQELLHNTHIKNKPKRVFVSTYCELSPKITGIIRKHWPILQNSFRTILDFKIPPLMSFKRPQNLKDRLVKSNVPSKSGGQQRFLGKQRLGSFPCLSCINCGLMQKGKSFVHPKTGAIFKIKHYLTCDSSWVIHALWCPCKLVYIGETTCDFKTRINHHRYTIQKKREQAFLSQNTLLSVNTVNPTCVLCYWIIFPHKKWV